MKKWLRYVPVGLVCMLLFTGCAVSTTESVKLRDLEYTLLSESLIPAQVQAVIEEKAGEAFQFTYKDKNNLYICIGYGTQKTGGYRIVVEELYLTEAAIYVCTTLLGPESKEESAPHNPVVVIKTEKLAEQVIYK